MKKKKPPPPPPPPAVVTSSAVSEKLSSSEDEDETVKTPPVLQKCEELSTCCSEEDDEGSEGYREGGYHPVAMGDSFNNSRYRVVDKLGWGHFSTVWCVEDTLQKRFVALKVQKSATHYTDAALDEIDLLRQVSRVGKSKKIVRLLDHFQHTGPNGRHVCMIFEMLGANLLSVIRKSQYRGLPVKVVKNFARQLVQGLDYLHTQCSIIHTDLKPENVLLRRRRKIGDRKRRRDLTQRVSVASFDEFEEQDEVELSFAPLTSKVEKTLFARPTGLLVANFEPTVGGQQMPKKRHQSVSLVPRPEQDDVEDVAVGRFYSPWQRLFEAFGPDHRRKPLSSLDLATWYFEDFSVRGEGGNDDATEAAVAAGVLAEAPLSLSTWAVCLKSSSLCDDSEDQRRRRTGAAFEALESCFPGLVFMNAPAKEPLISPPRGDPVFGLDFGAFAVPVGYSHGGESSKASWRPKPISSRFSHLVETSSTKGEDALVAEDHRCVDQEREDLAAKECLEEEDDGLIDLETAEIAIVDLGNACWRHKHFTEDIQTRQYRCPEVIVGADYDTSADIWSLACVLFELLTGDLLFDPRTGADYDRDEDHLAQMQELLGKYPKKLAQQARAFFNRKGDLKHIHNLNYWDLKNVLVKKYHHTEEVAQQISDFITPMLDFFPQRRATAAECLAHPWLNDDDDDAHRRVQGDSREGRIDGDAEQATAVEETPVEESREEDDDDGEPLDDDLDDFLPEPVVSLPLHSPTLHTTKTSISQEVTSPDEQQHPAQERTMREHLEGPHAV